MGAQSEYSPEQHHACTGNLYVPVGCYLVSISDDTDRLSIRLEWEQTSEAIVVEFNNVLHYRCILERLGYNFIGPLEGMQISALRYVSNSDLIAWLMTGSFAAINATDLLHYVIVTEDHIIEVVVAKVEPVVTLFSDSDQVYPNRVVP
jgi:hypothetical protein